MQEEIRKSLEAIGDSTRLDILCLLSKNGTMCGCALLKQLSITQGTLSHHMKILSEADLVRIRKEGRWRHYTLNKTKIFQMADFLKSLCSDRKCLCKGSGKDKE